MRSTFLAVGVLGLVGAFSACGGDDRPDNADLDGNGARSGSGGKSNNAGKANVDPGGAGGDGPTDVDPLAPKVVITAPIATADANGENVLAGDRVTATCQVTESAEPGAGKVNASSVKIAIVGADNKVIEEKVGSPTDTDDEYASELSLVTLPSGPVRFRCTAEDTEKHLGSAHLRTLLDQGPTIEFIKPMAMSAHALSKPLDIEFTVAPTLLTDEDEHAGVTEVGLNIAGVEFDLADAEDTPGHYRLQVDLQDPQFDPTPNGPLPVRVRATNERAPKPVTATLTQDPIIDGAGPTIMIISPLEKDVVGGKVLLKFAASDPVSGVDPRSVRVTVDTTMSTYSPNDDQWSLANGTYTYEFNTRQEENKNVQVSVNINAGDKVGNASISAPLLLYLDNRPPAIDLDPANIRTRTPNNQCSASFDPVGDLALNDLALATGGRLRALVIDQTNEDKDVAIPHFSGTNEKSVRLHLGPASEGPLLVDLDDDGVCDDVVEPNSERSQALLPVPKTGQPLYSKTDAAVPPALESGCETSDSIPPNLCSQKSEMKQVIQDEVNDLPLIYAISPSPNEVECTGVDWQFAATKLEVNGWICFATRAVDMVGNVGVSRPLRICSNDPRFPAPPCATSSVSPPSCTDGCTPANRLGNTIHDWE